MRPAGTGLGVERGFFAPLAFWGAGLAPGEAGGGPGGESDAAFAAGEGVSGGDPLGN